MENIQVMFEVWVVVGGDDEMKKNICCCSLFV
jgi:hypothetical protein